MNNPSIAVKGIKGFKTTYVNKNPRLYRIWRGILGRCRVKSDSSYRYYGAKGVSVCAEWLDFNTFQAWAINNGYSDSLLIDRIKPSGHYEPTNCRWVTMVESQRNRDSVFRNEDGLTISELAELTGLSNAALQYRKRHGIPFSLPKRRP